MFIADATQLAGRVIDFRADLSRVIERIQQKMQEATGSEASYKDALIALIQREREGEQSAKAQLIQAAINSLNEEFDLTLKIGDVLARLKKLEGYLGEFEDLVEPAISTLSETGDLFQIPLSASESRDFRKGDIMLSLGGDIDLAMAVRSFDAGSASEVWQGPIHPDSAIQETHVSGSLGVIGSASGTSGSVNLSGQLNASADASINIYHQYPGSTTRIAALVRSSKEKEWAPPWDLEGLESKLKVVDEEGRCVGFRRLQIHGNGAFSLAGTAAVGRALSYSKAIRTPAGPEVLKADALLGASLGVSLTRNGSYTLIIEKKAEGTLSFKLARSSNRRTAADLNLGADIEITGLDRVADPYVRHFFKDPAGLLTDLEKWLRPGDLLLEKLRENVPDKPVLKELSALLIGDASPEATSTLLIGLLKSHFEALLNERLSFWGEQPSAVADNLLNRLAGRLELDTDLSRRLIEELKPELESRIDDVVSDFETSIAAFFEQKGDDLEKVLVPFESVGQNIQQLATTINAGAEAVVQPTIDLLKRYQDIRNRLLVAVRKAANYKIGMVYTAAVSKESGSSTLLSFTMRKFEERAQIIHRAFILGKLGSVWAEFEAARSANEITDIEGRFSAFANNEKNIGFALNFGDLGVSRTRIRAEDIQVDVDPNGTILVASVNLSQEAIVKTFYQERSIDLVGAYDLALAAKNPDAFPTPLAFNLCYQDKKLKTEELEEFLQSLERAVCGRRLLSPGATQRAVNHWDSLAEHQQGGKQGARVDVALPVGITQLASLVTIDDSRIREKAAEILMELVPTPRQRKRAYDMIENDRETVSALSVIVAINKSLRNEDARSTDRTGQFIRRFRGIERDIDNLVHAIAGIRKIAALQRSLAKVNEETPADEARALSDQLESIADDINDSLRGWLETTSIIETLFSWKLPKKTIALMHLVSVLGDDQNRIIPLVSSLRDRSDQFVVA